MGPVEELARQLTTLDLEHGRGLGLARIRELLELETFVVLSPVQRLTGWGIDRLEVDNLPNPSRFTSALSAYLARAPHALFETAPDLRELLQPIELAHELHTLVCEGPVLLAWIGGFHGAPITSLQRERFAALLPAFRRRLAVDRVLAHQQRTSTALAAALEQIEHAAFILGPNGEIDGVNGAGRGLGFAALTDRQVERVPLPGTDRTLAIVRSDAEIERCEGRVQRAANSWRLTPRQREVLLLVIRGNANVQIAHELAIGERAVEQHVTAILARACVHNRTSLISLVLGAIVA
jgi:DNA-binding CsgD family transcriptional regulator